MSKRVLTVKTPERKAAFLVGLREGMSVTGAAIKAGISRAKAYAWRGEDESFAKEWEDALEQGTDLLEEAVHKRALLGTERPVYDKKGNLVGHVTEHHDTLAIFMLKARRPEKYKDRVHTELTGANGGPVQHEVSARDELASRIAGLASRGATSEPTRKPH